MAPSRPYRFRVITMRLPAAALELAISTRRLRHRLSRHDAHRTAWPSAADRALRSSWVPETLQLFAMRRCGNIDAGSDTREQIGGRLTKARVDGRLPRGTRLTLPLTPVRMQRSSTRTADLKPHAPPPPPLTHHPNVTRSSRARYCPVMSLTFVIKMSASLTKMGGAEHRVGASRIVHDDSVAAGCRRT